MLSDYDIRDALLRRGMVSEEKLDQLAHQAKKEGTQLEEVLLSSKQITEDELYRAAAELFGLPFASVDEASISSELLQRIPQDMAERYRIALFEESLGELGLVTSKLPEPTLLELIERKLALPIRLSFTSPSKVDAILRMYRVDVEEEIEKIDPTLAHIDVVELFRGIIENAVKMNASDVHIEPRRKRTVVRYRVDGDLKEITTLPLGLHAGVVSHVKILSDIKLEEHRKPQDGRFSFKGPGYKVSVRASTIPLLNQEKVVLRILRQDRAFKSLEDLGVGEAEKSLIEKVMVKKHGLVLVTGPTGSGKTTSLYTLLTQLSRPEINISTIEDPIEYNFETVNQSQVNMAVDYSFHDGLRGLLRQDPDVIMVGEIRDIETGTTALRAALTGHMVLSTLHTNDAPSSLTRLKEMGMANYLIASTVNLIIAQRLVKRLCDDCKTKKKITQKRLKEVGSLLGVDLIALMKTNKMNPASAHEWTAKGCPKCNNEGFSGRVGIFEILENTPEIYNAIIGEASAKTIGALAVKGGMRTLTEDGARKVIDGMTTFEELLRVL